MTAMTASRHGRLKRTKPGDVIFNVINITVFALFALICVFPFYYLFINTISDNELVGRNLITLWPQGIHFSNYLALKDVPDFGQSILITVSRTILGTSLMVFCSAFAGFLTTRREMWKRRIWYRMLVVTMYFNAGMIPWYMNMLGLGLTDNYLGYILPCIVSPYNIILVKTYIESIPDSLIESAKIDGATPWQIFIKVVLPLAKPILATIAVFGAVDNWNAFQDSLILMSNSPWLYTMQHRLWVYLNSSSNLAAAMQSGGAVTTGMMNSKVIKYTISMVTVLPIALVYPFMQRYFEEGIMLGAVKG
ncbi:carbohydrate ABC transporter permease [Faecalibaculum rodentium]|jgi:multiple sugar transport system permease protein/putative aldouronate transport system permease protein|uniref:carbohydrate ABC transporter permease n=1 Tax=Faecalibaculum rodentium TaxID=1702221 RepID=UPI001C3D1EC2|nr:carbohydrate ABC transporter permease [Faecalibaculum rodentium]